MDDCIAACGQLAIASYTMMDHGHYEETAALFTEGGTWVRGGTPVVGRDAILDALKRRIETDISRHFVTNIVVTRTGTDCARATALMVPLRGSLIAGEATPLTPPAMVADVFYSFRHDGSAWRIEHMEPRPVLRA